MSTSRSTINDHLDARITQESDATSDNLVKMSLGSLALIFSMITGDALKKITLPKQAFVPLLCAATGMIAVITLQYLSRWMFSQALHQIKNDRRVRPFRFDYSGTRKAAIKWQHRIGFLSLFCLVVVLAVLVMAAAPWLKVRAQDTSNSADHVKSPFVNYWCGNDDHQKTWVLDIDEDASGLAAKLGPPRDGGGMGEANQSCGKVTYGRKADLQEKIEFSCDDTSVEAYRNRAALVMSHWDQKSGSQWHDVDLYDCSCIKNHQTCPSEVPAH